MAFEKRIGFVGAGQMAEALARGLIAKGIVAADQVGCTSRGDARKDVFKSFGCTAYASNTELATNCDIIFIAVKPYGVASVLREIEPVIADKHTIVSIAAGITISSLVDAAGPIARIVRVMPNTPCMVGETAAAMCLGGKAGPEDEGIVKTIFNAVGKIYTVTESMLSAVTGVSGAGPEDEEIVKTLFNAVGKIYTVTESMLSAVTGVSGSGPAYIYLIIEAMADGGVRAGLPRDIAQALAAQTVYGSAKMVLETGKHPGQLKDMVTSPGGTTIAAVHELEKAGIRATMMNAVVAAANRADEMAKQY
eukprot:gene1349-32711_t